MTSAGRARWVLAVFVGLALWSSLSSTAFLEADDVTHYSYARWLGRYPEKSVDIWGRPLVTLFYALPAQLGPIGARCGSILLGVAAALLAVSLHRRAGGTRPAFAIAATLGLPYVFIQTCGVLTELIFSVVLAGGVVLWRARRPRAAALVWSLLPLARPEGFFLGILFGVAVLCVRAAHPSRRFSIARCANAALLGTGTLLWWITGLPVYRSAKWLLTEWPRNWSVASPYGSGQPFLFLAFLAIVVTPLLFPAFTVGVKRAWSSGRRLEIVVIAFVVTLHDVLWARGLFGSAGYPRYLVTLAPLLGAACADGLETIFEWWRTRAPARRPAPTGAAEGLLALAVIAQLFAWPNTGPYQGDVDAWTLEAVWPWCARQRAEHPGVRFIADHPLFFLQGDLDATREGRHFSPMSLRFAPPGSIAIFETKFAGRYSGMTRDEVLAAGFEPMPHEEVLRPFGAVRTGPRPRSADHELDDFRFDVLVKRASPR